jgi:hypothetical protein
MRFVGVAAVWALASAGAVQAQEAGADQMTVRSLLARDFSVVGVIPTMGGPGVFLAKKGELSFCLVMETKTSKTVATQYCKPVE